MAINPDPKPGRWILPLVVLGMVAFTYFFVRALPTGTADDNVGTTIAATDTTFPGNTADGDDPPTTGPDSTDNGSPDEPVEAYLNGVGDIMVSMEDLQQEMAAVNGGFDADPREVEYSDAVDRLEALADTAQTLVADMDELSVPDTLSTNHETIRTAVTTAAAAAEEAVVGLQSSDDGSQRRDAVAAFDSAVADLRTSIENARSAAGLSTEPTTDTTEGATTTTEGG